jgi:exonuclease SbcC
MAGAEREVGELRAALGMPADADTTEELARAHHALGVAHHAWVAATRELETWRDGAATPEVREWELELVAPESEARSLSLALGVAPGALDEEECERERDRTARALAVKREATLILAEARKRIVERVLPDTERNMKLLLPSLTSGRYHDAKVTGEYRIAVWDDEAGRYVGKNVFSGGARDQISLALRLAFAIATLPQELGASPGFLFLDEPLSSFDEERTRALVELLTRGRLAQIFPQICVISHSRSFDRGLFPYLLEMDRGRIAYTNL